MSIKFYKWSKSPIVEYLDLHWQYQLVDNTRCWVLSQSMAICLCWSQQENPCMFLHRILMCLVRGIAILHQSSKSEENIENNLPHLVSSNIKRLRVTYSCLCITESIALWWMHREANCDMTLVTEVVQSSAYVTRCMLTIPAMIRFGSKSLTGMHCGKL